MPKHEVRGRHILVTGASAGIGAEMAYELARRGARVGLIARREAELSQVLDGVRGAGGEGAFAVADVRDEEAMSQAVAQLVDELGPVYGLIANAGVAGPTRGGRIDMDVVARTFDVNLTGVARSISLVQPGMIERGEGFLAAVSSIASFLPLAGHGAYSASKAGLSNLMAAIRPHMCAKGISVTTIHPGYIRTAMTADNKHSMPLLMDPDKAARIIVRGVLASRRAVSFPWPMVMLTKFAGMLPAALFDWAMARQK